MNHQEICAGPAKLVLATQNRNILISQIGLCLTMQNEGEDQKLDPASTQWLGIKRNMFLLIEDGMITHFQPTPPPDSKRIDEEIDGSKLVCIPGLIDSHSHPIFAGSRSLETVQKSQGMTYEDISKRGGGIAVTMSATRTATDLELIRNFQNHARQSLHRGVVLLEAKTGYGLSPTQEGRLLKCLIDAYNPDFCADPKALPFLAPTLMPLHASSPEFQGFDRYLNAALEDLPRCASIGLKAAQNRFGTPLATDIFVERDYFSKEHADKWFSSAIQHGLNIHVHADEFSRSGGSEAAISIASRLEQTESFKPNAPRVLSVDHCQYTTEFDLTRLKQHGVTAVALPCTSFFSSIAYLDAKKIRSSGIRLAIGTDFNPGSSPFNNLWFASYLAVTKCGFSLAEVYRGITINAAFALGVQETFGKIQLHQKSNLVLFEGREPEDLLSSPLGDHIRFVIKTPDL